MFKKTIEATIAKNSTNTAQRDAKIHSIDCNYSRIYLSYYDIREIFELTGLAILVILYYIVGSIYYCLYSMMMSELVFLIGICLFWFLEIIMFVYFKFLGYDSFKSTLCRNMTKNTSYIPTEDRKFFLYANILFCYDKV